MIIPFFDVSFHISMFLVFLSVFHPHLPSLQSFLSALCLLSCPYCSFFSFSVYVFHSLLPLFVQSFAFKHFIKFISNANKSNYLTKYVLTLRFVVISLVENRKTVYIPGERSVQLCFDTKHKSSVYSGPLSFFPF